MQDLESSDNNADNAAPDAAPAAAPGVPQLLAMELRVLGALMEKQLTTPDQYPLTINSIVTACNQKSSREPVTNYHQGEVLRTLRELEERHFVRREYGSRADKYSQHFIAHLGLGKKQQAVLCIMMLRGPQTFSELFSRTQRMELFSDKEELNHCVERLCEREVPYAIRLGTPGQRGERVAHLFSGVPEFTSSAPTVDRSTSSNADASGAVVHLEQELASLKETVEILELENASLRRHLEMLYELTGHELREQ